MLVHSIPEAEMSATGSMVVTNSVGRVSDPVGS